MRGGRDRFPGNGAAYLRRILVVAAVALVCSASTAGAEEASASRSELIRSLLPTVVNIAVRKETPIEAQIASAAADTGTSGDVKNYVGSGFIIDQSGLIVTNYHVVEGAFEIAVTLYDGTVLSGKMVHASRLADLAVVQVQAGHPLQPVQWGDSNKVHVGDQVFAIGDPLGIGMSVSGGIVSGLNRNAGDSPYDNYIQTDAALNHGNSGGPLFDMEGRVVGVDTALVSPTDASAGLGLAIPADDARFVVDRLLKYGWVRPGWMGVKVQQVTRDFAEAMGLPRPEGSVVSWLPPNSPAGNAGIKIGDVIIKYGDDTPSDERALLRDIGKTSIGLTVPVVVLRDSKQLTIPVTINAWPRSRWDELDAPETPQRPQAKIPADLGLWLASVQPDERAKLGLQDGDRGVMIKGVLPDTDAARRGAVSGDVILRVQDKAVATPDDVQHAIDAARADHHPFVMMLVLQKARKIPGPSWIALRVSASDG